MKAQIIQLAHFRAKSLPTTIVLSSSPLTAKEIYKYCYDLADMVDNILTWLLTAVR